MDLIIKRLDAFSSPALELLRQSDALMQNLYPPESNHLVDPATLMQPDVLYIGAYINNELLGCGAVKQMQDDGHYGEIKRVFVLEKARGLGISKRIMQELEAHCVGLGVLTVRLETGIHQPQALGLYEKLGYQYRDPFGSYQLDPLSVFMEKRLVTG